MNERPTREDDKALRQTVEAQAKANSKLQSTIFGLIAAGFLGGFAVFQVFGNVERQVIVNTSGLHKITDNFEAHVRESNRDIGNIKGDIGIIKNEVSNTSRTISEIKMDSQKSNDKIISTLEDFGKFHAKTDDAINRANEYMTNQDRQTGSKK